MKYSNRSEDKQYDNKLRKLYINLLSEKMQQPEDFCGNKIKTTRYTM